MPLVRRERIVDRSPFPGSAKIGPPRQIARPRDLVGKAAARTEHAAVTREIIK